MYIYSIYIFVGGIGSAGAAPSGQAWRGWFPCASRKFPTFNKKHLGTAALKRFVVTFATWI